MVVHKSEIIKLINELNSAGFEVEIPDKIERMHLLNILLKTKFLQPESTFERWLAYDRMLNHPMLVVKSKDKLVGFINFNIRKSNFGHVGYIRSVYVSPDFRGKGIAKKMINIAELFLPKPHWMIVDKDNKIMLDTTKKLSYYPDRIIGNKIIVAKN